MEIARLEEQSKKLEEEARAKQDAADKARKEVETRIATEEQKQKHELEVKTAQEAAETAHKEAEAKKAAEEAALARITREKAQKEADRLANARGGVIVRTTPPGAMVTLGGEAVEKSPATFKSLNLGKYPIKIILDGYESVSQEVEVKEKEFADLGLIVLVQITGSMEIMSEPTGAVVTHAGNLPQVWE